MYGSECFQKEFNDLGYQPELATGGDGQVYAIFKDFEIEIGRFAGRIIDLALLIPADYPRMVHSSIHVKAMPLLLEKKDNVPGVLNIIDSGLGTEWQYWSFAFKTVPEDTGKHLMSQIVGVFKRI